MSNNTKNNSFFYIFIFLGLFLFITNCDKDAKYYTHINQKGGKSCYFMEEVFYVFDKWNVALITGENVLDVGHRKVRITKTNCFFDKTFTAKLNHPYYRLNKKEQKYQKKILITSIIKELSKVSEKNTFHRDSVLV